MRATAGRATAGRAATGRGGTTADAPGAGPSDRAALTLGWALVGLSCLWALLAFAPGMWGWGLDALRFLPRGPGWAVWAVGTLLLAPPVAGPVAAALERVSAGPRRHLFIALLFIAGAALLTWALPDRVAFTGDSLLRASAALEPLPPRHLFPQALPLDVALHYRVLRLLVSAGVPGADEAARLLGSLEAALLAGLALAFARVLGLRGAAALAAASIAFFGGWLGLFTGYSKAFTELVVLTLAVAVLALRVLPAGAGLTSLGLALALAFALHRSSVALLPAGAVALVLGARARAAPTWRRPGPIAAFAIPGVVLVVLVPRLLATFTGFDWVHHLLPPSVARGGVGAAALSPLHLLDLVNLIAQLSPVVLVLPALLVAGGPGLLGGREGLVLLLLAVPQLLLMLFVHPSQGVFRDWDVFAPGGAALALLAALAVGRILEASPARRWLGVSVAAAVAAPATSWLIHSADLDRGLERVEAFATESPLRSEDERGLIWEFLGTSANVRGRSGTAADAMARAAALTPSARVMMEWGMAEATLGNYAVARQAFEVAALRDPSQPRVWLNLVHACMRLDDLEGARRAAQELARLTPGSAPAAQLLAEIERQQADREHRKPLVPPGRP